MSWSYLNQEVNGSTTTAENATGTGASPSSSTTKSGAVGSTGLVSWVIVGFAGLFAVGIALGL